MADDWELEDWFLNSYQQVMEKREAPASLTQAENFLYELGCLDCELRNGGASQYFANQGTERWQQLKNTWSTEKVPSFTKTIDHFDAVLASQGDAYEAMLAASPSVEELYEQDQAAAKRELQKWLKAKS
ncbi:MAG: DUF4375 domain-containing protein [Pseudomonadota bacterium]